MVSERLHSTTAPELHQKETDTLNEAGIEENYKVKLKDIWPQVVYTLISCVVFIIQIGINYVYSNLILTHVDASTGSWITSLSFTTSTACAIVAGLVAHKLPRKKMHLAVLVPCLLSWSLFALGDIEQPHLLIIARVLSGIIPGFSAMNTLYMAEIINKKYRTMISSLVNVFLCTGILLTTVMGTWLSWKFTAFVFLIVYLLSVIFSFYMVESPIFLMNSGEKYEEEAKKALRKLNPNPQVFAMEWSVIRKMYQLKNADETVDVQNDEIFNTGDYVKSVLIPALLFLLSNLSGTYIVLTYAVTIISKINVENEFSQGLDPRYLFLMFGVVRFLTSIAVVFISRWYGRKPLLISSATGMAICSFGLWLAMNFLSPDYEHRNLINTVSFLGYSLSNGISVMHAPFVMTPEILPSKIKGIGTSFLFAFCYIVSFITTKLLPKILAGIGIGALFFLFGVMSLVMAMFTYFCVPETHGKFIHGKNIFRQK